MKTKIIVSVMVVLFSVCVFSGAAWTKNSAKAKNQKSYEYHHNFLWLKIYWQLLKLEKDVALLKYSVRKLDNQLDTETMERRTADERLRLMIDDEAETRAEGDIALGQQIDNEAAQRERGDDQLGEMLEEETTARMQADEDLQEQIDSIETGATKVPLFFSSGAEKVEPVTFYRMGVAHLSREITYYGMVAPLPGTISDLYGFSIFKPEAPTSESISFELLVNNRLTGLKCTITGTDNCSIHDFSVSVDAGDTLAVLVFPTSQFPETEVGASVVLETTGSQDFN